MLLNFKFLFLFLIKFIHSDILEHFSHEDGEEIILTVGSINSVSTQIPYDYYYLGVCAPEDPIQVPDNLGEILMGSKSYYTNYKINVNKDAYCKVLCQKTLSRKNMNAFTWLIKKDYRISWYLDSLPAGYANSVDILSENPHLEVTYDNGIPIGYIKNTDYYVYNHYRLYVYTHKAAENKSQIVGFEIEPFSIEQTNSTICKNIEGGTSVVELLKSKEQKIEKDLSIYFTYDVIFKESNITFASRFDHYHTSEQKNVHVFGVINSNILIFVLSFITIIVFIRSIRKDIEIYNTRVTADDLIDEYGWKEISNDVFRKPIHFSLLSSLVGTGFQVLIMIAYTLIFASLGFFRPEVRGGMLTMMVMVFVFLGVVGGYISARVFKLFHGRNWLKNAFMTALLFPLFCFSIILLANWLYRIEGSNIVLNFNQIFSIIILWVLCSTPLVLLGAFLGIKQRGIQTPGKINPVPSPIPQNKPWYLHLKFSCWITGIVPFGAIFIEFIYVISALWKHQLYFFAGFIFVAFIVLLIISSEVGLLYTYVNLCKGDYNWWWKCFFASASPVIYVILYSIYYFFTLKITRLSTIIIYFSVTSLLSSIIILVCGSVGISVTFIFLHKIYSMIKVD